MTTTTTNVLITGANRGIGKGLFTAYLSQPNTTVIAAVRTPSSPSSQSLLSLPRGANSTPILVQIDSLSETDALAAITQLRSAADHGITHLDIVIANAGIMSFAGKVKDTPASELLAHFKVNTVAPVLLFQATLPLLEKAENPKFVAVSSAAGSLAFQDQLVELEAAAYGGSKAALNFVTRRIHLEHPGIITFALNPGWLQSDMGNFAAKNAGKEQAPVTIEDGVKGIIEQIDKATKVETSGTFVGYDGNTVSW